MAIVDCLLKDIDFARLYYKQKRDVALKIIPGALLVNMTEDLKLKYRRSYVIVLRASVDEIYNYLDNRCYSITRNIIHKPLLPENTVMNVLDMMVTKRTQQLTAHGFSQAKIAAILEGEQEFLGIRALVKVRPFRECEFLNQFNDEQCIALFGFDRLAIKYLALVLMIPQQYVITKPQIVLDGNKENEKTTYKITCDPAIQLLIYFYRKFTSGTLHHASHFFKMSPSQLFKIESKVLNWIYLNFSHLLNIDSCVYNESNLEMLVAKSNVDSIEARKNTCYAIDGTHAKIAKPSTVDDLDYDITLDASESSYTLAYQWLTDIFGVLIDVTSGTYGSKHDMDIFKDLKNAEKITKLRFEDHILNVVGDSAYEADIILCNFYSVPKGEDARDDENRLMQENLSKVRSSFERVFGERNNVFKSPSSMFENGLYVNHANKTYLVNFFLSNLKEILYTTTTSGELSDALPVDMYCHF